MRISFRPVALLAAAALIISPGPGPAGAQPASDAAAPAARAAVRVPTTVRLVTGDVVTVGSEQGKQTVSVTPARRASGVPVTFSTASDGDHFYVIPSDAAPYLRSNTLDLRLFDVRTLAAQGGTSPVIVQYAGRPAPSSLAKALPGRTVTLESIGAVAADPAGAEVWTALTKPASGKATLASGGVRKVWLDSKVHADLDVSVPQIGAPQVWQAGYDGTGVKVAVLDTGIDAGHPDLAGKVAVEQNFTDDPAIADGNGHGTHVASTLVGSGAASAGRYKGVAPGAELMVGKVLRNDGNGFLSWAIDGMEWAAHNGADVVSMSLSAPATDGTDPGSMAVDALSAETGTLFVIAAGNEYNDATVGTPGAATSALTVGAVDDGDTLADFSSRGPRRGDAAIKPNITAPGVGIVAARAAGTSLGAPVDDNYTSLSGTSMATPHVAGAAALLVQAHPDWTGQQVKDALVSTAVPGDYTPYQQGAGRVDVAKAYRQGVYGPAVIDFGKVPDPSTVPVVRTLEYRNDTDTAVTLDLSVSGKGWDGAEVPAGALTLSSSSMTVPAHGSGSVELTADPGLLDSGVHSGVVVANGNGVGLRTPWSLYEASGSHRLDVSLKDRRGNPADLGLPIWIVKDDPGFVANDPFRSWNYFARTDPEGNASFDVAPGVYDVYAQITTWQLEARESTVAVASEVEVSSGTAVTLDAGQAERRNPKVGETTDTLMGELSIIRHTPDNREFRLGALFEESTDWELFSTATAKPKLGWTESYTKWILGSSLVQATVQGGPELKPEYWPHAAGPNLSGKRTLPVVYTGDGSDLTGAVGKLALVRVPVAGAQFPYVAFLNGLQSITETAAALGVKGVLAYADLPGALGHQVRAEPILQLGLSYAEGEALRMRSGAKLTIDGRRSPERVYHLRLGNDGGYPTVGDPVIGKHELASWPARYHSDSPTQEGQIAWFAFSPNMPDSSQLTVPFWAPTAWTELVASRGPALRWTRQTWLEDTVLRTWDVIRPGERRGTESWFQAPISYGALDVAGSYPTQLVCTFCRQGDRFASGQYRIDASGKHYEFAWFDPPQVRLYDGTTEIPRQGSSWKWWRLPPGTGTFRLNMQYTQPGSAPTALATKIDTDWVFRSAPPSAGTLPAAYGCPFSTDPSLCGFDPLIQLRYDLGLGVANTAPTGERYGFDITAGPLSGALDRTPVSGVQVWFSTDDGTTWKAASVHKKSRNTYGVSLRHPDTPGYVWLRVRASNATGSVDQTVQRAYRLESR